MGGDEFLCCPGDPEQRPSRADRTPLHRPDAGGLAHLQNAKAAGLELLAPPRSTTTPAMRILPRLHLLVAQIVVLPESRLLGRESPATYLHACPIPGEDANRLCDLAKN